MIGLVVLLVIAGLVGYLIWKTSEPDTPSEVDAEQAIKAAIELHKIRRNLDAAWTKSQQQRDGTRLRREIAEALKDERR